MSRLLIIAGHLVSSLGCRLRGGHVPLNGRFRSYCRDCGRLIGTIPLRGLS